MGRPEDKKKWIYLRTSEVPDLACYSYNMIAAASVKSLFQVFMIVSVFLLQASGM